MNRHPLPITVLVLVVLTVPARARAVQDDRATDPAPVDFVTQIKPIFEQHCLECHGPEEEEAFRIDDREVTLEDYVVAGEPDESDLYNYLISDSDEDRMPPPEEGEPLDPDQIALIRTWIEQGASWPDDVTFALPDEDHEADHSHDATGPDGAANEPSEQADRDSSDRAAPRAANKDREPSLTRAIGSLHPAALHLPIGLLLAAGFFSLLSLRGNFVMSDCAYYCLWLGALTAVIACVTGWYFGPMEHYNPVTNWNDLMDTESRLFWHRTSALAVTAAAIVLALFAASARNRDPDDGWVWKLGLILLAAGVGFVGHEGGELSWNKNGKHYRDLQGIVGQYLPWFANENDKKNEPDDKAANDAGSRSQLDTGEAHSTDATESDASSDDLDSPETDPDEEDTVTGQTSNETQIEK